MNNINKIIKGVSLLTDINLAIESGHIYGFVGDNGSGKTVLFKVLLGLMHKTSDHSGRWQGTEGSDAGCWFYH